MESERLLLVRELESEICHCGNAKQRNQTFCKGCYYRLTPPMRKALYRRLGSGYAEAVDEAKIFLRGVTR